MPISARLFRRVGSGIGSGTRDGSCIIVLAFVEGYSVYDKGICQQVGSLSRVYLKVWTNFGNLTARSAL